MSMIARALCLTRLLALASAFAIMGVAQLASQGNDPSVCNPALARDRVQILRTDHQRFAYLNRIDQETYQQLKKDIEAGLRIPVVDLFVKASSSYSDFVERRESFFQEIGYEADPAYEEVMLHRVTEPVAYAASAACMEELAKRHVGFHAWKKLDRADLLVIDYYWHAPFGVKSARAVSEITGGSVRDMPKRTGFPRGKRFQPNEAGTLEIRRDPGAGTLLVTLGAEGYTAQSLLSVYSFGQGAIGTAVLRLTFDTGRVVGALETSVTSVNNHKEPCGTAANCSPDRKWRASVHGLTLDAGEGRILRGAHVKCVGMSPAWRAKVEELERGNDEERSLAGGYQMAYANVCAYSQVTQAPVDGGRVVNTQVLSWTRPTYFVLRATVVEPQTIVDTTQRMTIVPRGSFVVRVPSTASTAVIQARACGGETSATPGHSSRDKRLVYVGHADIGDDQIAYLYRYEPPRDEHGKFPHACALPGVTRVNAVEAAARFLERYDAGRRQE